jgi:hypothetical protein
MTSGDHIETGLVDQEGTVRGNIPQISSKSMRTIDEESGKLVLLFCITFVESDRSSVLLHQILQDRGDHLSRSTPIRIEINNARQLARELPLPVLLIVGDMPEKCLLGEMFHGTPLQLVVRDAERSF